LSAQEHQIAGFRLSPQQELQLGRGGQNAIAQCAAFVTVSADELRQGIRGAVQRHEILRTAFPQTAGLRARTQVIRDSPEFEWITRAEPVESEPGWLAGVLATEAERPFDLDRGPLVRALLIGAGEDPGLVVLSAHAACADAASLAIVLREAIGGGGLSPDPVQYADYAQWRHELITGEEPETNDADTFWRANADAPVDRARLLFERRATDGTEHSGMSRVSVNLEAETVSAAAERYGATEPQVLEAAWHALIAKCTRRGELVLAGWSDGRSQPDLEDAVGPYQQPLPLPCRIDPETTFSEVLDQIGRAREQAATWQDYASAKSLQVVLRAASAGFAALEFDGLDPVVATPPAGVSSLLLLRTTGDRRVAELWYDTNRHEALDATALAAGLRALLTGARADPERPVLELGLCDESEQAELLALAAGQPSLPEAATAVHEQFERQADLTPDAPAVADAAGSLSYMELDRATNQLAALLRELGVAPGDTVAICMERSTRLLAAVLGVMKAGAAYLPLNHEHPPARLSHQLTESRAAAIITEEHLLDRLPEGTVQVVCMDRDADRIATFPDERAQQARTPEDLAYVMYTSGSTGLPKGVAVSHGNLANYATSIVELIGAGGQGWRFGVLSAISTDLGNTCIFPPLICGGCVQLISPGAAMDAGAIREELSGATLDVLKVTPSHLRALISEDSTAVLPSRWLLLGGEALSWDLVQRIEALGPACEIVNHYGPTETTIGCCAHVIGERRLDCATVPIGRPLAGVRAYVLGAGADMLPAGVPGELCIGGAGVTNGYVGPGGEDDGPFAGDPFGGGRMYRTGDLARYLRDGAIEFLGRVDEQVKIRGFRIEPGEIEATLLRHPAVRQAAVVAERDERDELRLVGYVATSAAPTVQELQEFLASSLPEYMIPSAFAMLSTLPFTASGKVDRRALRELATAQTRRHAGYVAPRDEVESQIAAIWSELLGVERVGVFDEFFALGGHSLLATQAIMRIRREHGNIPLGALLAAPTVADLAEVVRAAAAERVS
jgi:amino acid adenylation domain-containing protein